ncbi:mitochondrial ribosomal large subunit component [Tulasnella sp. 427]|nr:mitochondrial ribosomal large subunit component [Tulasnella sp. 427]
MSLLSSFRNFSIASRSTPLLIRPIISHQQTRFATKFAPTFVRHPRVHKGRAPVPIGGSIKGTALNFGDYGIRVKSEGMRISAKQLQAAETALKRKLKPIKGSKVWMRVFPDMPVCVKGNETRMGKGKGSFEYWACWVPTGRVLFEIAGEPGGAELRPELAREALRLAADKLPCTVDMIDRASPHRLGNLDIHRPKNVAGKNSIAGNVTSVATEGGDIQVRIGGVRGLQVSRVEKPTTDTVA